MDQLQIINGFSDIKLQFAGKCHITKPLHQLRLWFTFNEGILWVHDYDKHSTCMIIAVEDLGKWTVTLIKDSLGANLVLYGIQKSKEMDQSVAEIMNDAFKMHGFY